MLTSTLSLADRKLIILDTETTGLSCDQGHEIIELAAEKIMNGEVVDEFHSFVLPLRPIPLDATAIHGLDNEFIATYGQPAEHVFPNFASFIEDGVLVGHNIRRFDHPFLMSHYRRLGLELPENDIVDTLEIARTALRLPNYKLGTIASHFGISTDGAHRAAADVAMTRKVLFAMMAGQNTPAIM